MKNYLLPTLVAATIATVLFLCFKSDKTKTGYVELQKVFDGFGYKKEVEASLKMVEERRKRELDSLELDLKVLFREVELSNKNVEKVAVFETKREVFLKKREAYSSELRDNIGRYDEMILKQMNSYIGEYGKKNGYTYIFGADGKGNLMYADTTNNITAEIIDYINKKYQGK